MVRFPCVLTMAEKILSVTILRISSHFLSVTLLKQESGRVLVNVPRAIPFWSAGRCSDRLGHFTVVEVLGRCAMQSGSSCGPLPACVSMMGQAGTGKSGFTEIDSNVGGPTLIAIPENRKL
jgi:hypothetical protein